MVCAREVCGVNVRRHETGAVVCAVSRVRGIVIAVAAVGGGAAWRGRRLSFLFKKKKMFFQFNANE